MRTEDNTFNNDKMHRYYGQSIKTARKYAMHSHFHDVLYVSFYLCRDA